MEFGVIIRHSLHYRIRYVTWNEVQYWAVGKEIGMQLLM